MKSQQSPPKTSAPPPPSEQSGAKRKTPAMPSERHGPKGHDTKPAALKPAPQGDAKDRQGAMTATEDTYAPKPESASQDALGDAYDPANLGSGSNARSGSKIKEPLPESLDSHNTRVRSGALRGNIQGGVGRNADTRAAISEKVGVPRHAGTVAQHAKGGGHGGSFKGGHFPRGKR